MKLRDFLWILTACTAMAHDLDITVQRSSPVVVVQATYYGHDPAVFAKVAVYSPSRKQQEYQRGQTDLNGTFSFVPREAGEWTVIVDDEGGHREKITVNVAGESAAEPARAAPAAQPLWQKLVTGLSLILGLAGLLYGVSNRRTAG